MLTHTLKINKVDEQNKPLSGAEFALYRNNVDSGKLKFVDPECEVVSSAKKMGITFGE